MFKVLSWFGSPFAGQVCDDGKVTVVGKYSTLEEAKDCLKQHCDAQRCLTYLAEDGLSASFANWNDSPTGGARIEEIVFIDTHGNKRARPDYVLAGNSGRRAGDLWAFFEADSEHDYDDWLFWSKDTPETRAELTANGVAIEEDDSSEDEAHIAAAMDVPDDLDDYYEMVRGLDLDAND